MPTLLNVDGYRFVIWMRDHEPPHVHVFRAGKEVKIAIGDADNRPRVLSDGLGNRETVRALQMVAENQAMLLDAWRRIHG